MDIRKCNCNMKKQRMLVLICSIFFLICTGCEKNLSEEWIPIKDHIFYPAKNLFSFAISEAGNVVTAVYNLETNQNEIYIYSLDGNLIKKQEVESVSEIQAITVQGEDLYFIGGTLGEVPKLYYMNLSKKEMQVIFSLEKFSKVERMEICEDTLYLLARNPALEDLDYGYADENDKFVYSGEQIVCFNLISKKIAKIDIDFPIAFSVMENGTLFISAHDDNGFYFTTYIPKKKRFSKKKYRNDLGQLSCLQAIGTKGAFLYREKWFSSEAVFYTKIDKESKQELVPEGLQVVEPQDIFYRKGLTFYRSSDGVEMVRNQVYLRDEKVIRVAKCGDQGFVSAPFGCGYEMKIENLDEESFSLALLSQDMDYDLYMLQSNQGISEHIRDQGSFYPLNNVKYVKKFFDASLPYIQEAATDKNGMIWMIPFYVSTNTIVYSEEIEKYGISFKKDMDLAEFLESVQILFEKKEQEEVLSVNGNYLIRYLMQRYFQEYSYLNTAEFREIAVLLKEIAPCFNGYVSGPFGIENMTDQSELLDGKREHLFLLSLETMIVPAIYNMKVHAMPVPSLNEEEKIPITCYFMTVNPSSSHRKSTLAYISSFINYFLLQKDTMILSNVNAYTDTQVARDFYNIYKNGEIYYAIPEELYLDDIFLYLAGEKELEEVITESDRKIDIYRKQ